MNTSSGQAGLGQEHFTELHIYGLPIYLVMGTQHTVDVAAIKYQAYQRCNTRHVPFRVQAAYLYL
jgi:hypothetical protein